MIVHIGNEVFSNVYQVWIGYRRIELRCDDRDITIEEPKFTWIEEEPSRWSR